MDDARKAAIDAAWNEAEDAFAGTGRHRTPQIARIPSFARAPDSDNWREWQRTHGAQGAKVTP